MKYEELAPLVIDKDKLIFENNTAKSFGSKFSSGYPA